MNRIKFSNLEYLRVFYHVSEKLSFTAAAKAMGYGVPALSKKVAALESDLGKQLFHRTTRSLSLTDDAREILPLVKVILEDIEQLEHYLHEDESISGTIRMTCLPSLAQRHLAVALLKFKKIYPDIRFQLHLSDQVVDMIEMGIDIAIRVQAPQGADFIYRKLIPNELMLCASPKYLDSVKHKIKSPKDLRTCSLLFLSAYRNLRFLGTDYSLKDFEKSRSIECESGHFLTELALGGAGIAVRSIWDIKKYLHRGSLVQILPSYKIDNLGFIYAVTPPGKKISRRIRTFLDFIAEESKFWNQ